MNQHSGQGSPPYPEAQGSTPLWALEMMFFVQRGFTHLIMGGVFERFPKLRYIMTESGCSWAPGLMRQMDAMYHGWKKPEHRRDRRREGPGDEGAAQLLRQTQLLVRRELPGPARDRGPTHRRPGQDPLGQRLPALRGQLPLLAGEHAPGLLGGARAGGAHDARRERREALWLRSGRAATRRERGQHHAGARRHRARRDSRRLAVPGLPARAHGAALRSMAATGDGGGGRIRCSALPQGSRDARAPDRGGQAGVRGGRLPRRAHLRHQQARRALARLLLSLLRLQGADLPRGGRDAGAAAHRAAARRREARRRLKIPTASAFAGRTGGISSSTATRPGSWA